MQRRNQLRVRRNGCHWPPSCCQVLALLSLTYQLVLSTVLIVPLLTSYERVTPTQVIFCVVSLPLQTMSLGLGLALTLSDPTARLVAMEQEADSLGLEQQQQSEAESTLFLCSLCKARVGKSSIHCGTCNRCVCGFDQHFKWTNNCVGSRNYHLFVETLGSLVLSEAALTAFLAHFIYLSFETDLETACEEYLSWDGLRVVQALSILCACISTFLLVGAFRLLISQIWLRFIKHKTAYQHHHPPKQRNSQQESIDATAIEVSVAGRSMRRTRVVLPTPEAELQLSQLRAKTEEQAAK